MSQALSASTSSDNDAKADQIAHKFINKFALLVADARATQPVLTPRPRIDKWFNLETAETDQFRDALRSYRSLSSSSPAPAPFVVNVVLAVPELSNGEVVVFTGDDGQRVPLRPTPEGILLEQWTLAFAPAATSSEVVPLSTVYKHAIATFRSLYALLRVLPAWKIHKRASRRARSRTGTSMGTVELHLGDRPPHGVLDFGTQLSHTTRPIRTSTHAFAPVIHPAGTLSISAQYLSSVEFQIVALESLLSSTFLRQDQPDPTQALQFTPTVARHRTEQHGSTGSSGSYGQQQQRPSLTGPASAPRPASGMFSRTDVDRFIVPRDSGRALTPTSDVAFPTGSRISPKLALLKLEDPSSGSPGRNRRDSSGLGGTGSSGSADAGGGIPPSPVSFPAGSVRRPSINTIHPFKSSTLSGSLHSPSPAQSLRTQSPLTTIAGSSIARASPLPLTPSAMPRPISFPAASGMSGIVGSPSSMSPVGAGAMTRPSPPYTPSSLVERRSIGAGSASGGSDPSTSVAPGTSAKRYSSTFGHRFSTSTSTPQEDITNFMQAINESQGQPLRHAREASGPDPEAEERALRAGAIPTSQREVGDALRAMQEQFAKSLEGLEGSRRRRDSGGSESGSSPSSQPQQQFRAPGAGVPERPPAPFRPPERPQASRRDSGGAPSPLATGFTPSTIIRPTATRRESGEHYVSSSPYRAGETSASPFRTGDPAAVFSRPPIHRRDSTEPQFVRPLDPVPRTSTHRRDSTEPASPFSRQPLADSPSARRTPDSPTPYGRAALDSPNPYARPSSNSPRLAEESPFRDSDDNASDRGSLQLRWRPRVGSRGGGGGTDSEGERAPGGGGGSASDIVGRMEL